MLYIFYWSYRGRLSSYLRVSSRTCFAGFGCAHGLFVQIVCCVMFVLCLFSGGGGGCLPIRWQEGGLSHVVSVSSDGLFVWGHFG